MNKVNAQHLANTARSLVSLLQDNCKATISGTITEWNTCVKQAGFFGVYDFPTTGYTRKAQLQSDLIRCFEQLDDFEEGKDLVHDVDAAHAEALLLNLGVEGFRRVQLYPETVVSEAEAHAEALGICNAVSLIKLADECISELNEGRPSALVVADWNNACRLAGMPLLGFPFTSRSWPANVMVNVMNLRKTILDIKVNP